EVSPDVFRPACVVESFDGTFRVFPGRFRGVVWSPGRGLRQVNPFSVAAGERLSACTVPGPRVVRGMVVDREGKACYAGVDFLTDVFRLHWFETDADGVFLVRGIPSWECSLGF